MKCLVDELFESHSLSSSAWTNISADHQSHDGLMFYCNAKLKRNFVRSVILRRTAPITRQKSQFKTKCRNLAMFAILQQNVAFFYGKKKKSDEHE